MLSLTPVYMHVASMKQDSGNTIIYSHNLNNDYLLSEQQSQSALSITETIMNAANEAGSIELDDSYISPSMPSDDAFFIESPQQPDSLNT
jgi:hypothetical protein